MSQTQQMPRFGTTKATATEPVTTDSLAAGWEKRTVQEALDEVARELGVRERVYVRWVQDGKHSKSDACDRLQRMILAAAILHEICEDQGLSNAISAKLAERDMDEKSKIDAKPF